MRRWAILLVCTLLVFAPAALAETLPEYRPIGLGYSRDGVAMVTRYLTPKVGWNGLGLMAYLVSDLEPDALPGWVIPQLREFYAHSDLDLQILISRPFHDAGGHGVRLYCQFRVTKSLMADITEDTFWQRVTNVRWIGKAPN